MQILPFADFVIGIDGGGSKTTALIADRDGNILGRGVSGPSNYLVIGAEAAYVALDAAVEAAAGEQPVRPAALCLGMAGAARPADQAVLRAWTDARYPGAPVVITHDARLALAAGTPEGWGVAVLCGTGSMVYGEDQHGQVARADGWGYLLDDDGSGYAIGRAALRAVARAADGCSVSQTNATQTALTEAILTHWSLAQPQDLIGHVYKSTQRADIAALAALTQAVALQGDVMAGVILQDAGRELAIAVEAVARRLALTGTIPCALTGSVILKGQSVRAAFVAATVERGLTLSPLTPVHEPVQGAIRLGKALLSRQT